MRNQRLIGALVCATLAIATSARAQDGSAQEGPEITPYVFLGSNASSGIGAAVRWPLPGPFSVEVETSYRRSAVSPLNANLSLLFDFPQFVRMTPYVAAGIGLDQYAFADSALTGQVVTQAGTTLSVNAGGGVRVRSNENWGIRADARWFNGLGERAPERWRLYNGVTFGPKGR
jgi:hypothetical protein